MQKAFTKPSGGAHSRTDSWPRVIANEPGAGAAGAEADVPVRFWQRLQWHQPALANGAEISKETVPHRHDPVITRPSLRAGLDSDTWTRSSATTSSSRGTPRGPRWCSPTATAATRTCGGSWRRSSSATTAIVLFDHVGAGGSDPRAYDPERYGRLDGYADDVVAILEELDLRDAVFVGHSVSAMIGVLAARRRPGPHRQAGARRPVAALHR